MTRSRVERLERTREKRRRLYTVGGLALAAVGIVAIALVIGLTQWRTHAESQVPTADSSAQPSLLETSVATATAPVLVVVPSVCGLKADGAQTLLEAAGFLVVRVPTPARDAAPGTVLEQVPAAGEQVPAGSEISITCAEAVASAPAPEPSVYVVCLDPGHQARGNADPEPIGPKSSETKPKVTGGAVGVVTRQPEHELVLDVAKRVKQLLEARRVKVVMTRTSADVDISNSERAEVANDAGADLFVRIHADSNTNADISGASTLYPAGNSWVKPIEVDSLAAARAVQAAVVAATGTADRGLVKRSDLAGFNYCDVPAVLVEMGFLSNPVEDRRLAEDAYRNKVAQGIADGIMAWLEQ